jgi:hypothetical protein
MKWIRVFVWNVVIITVAVPLPAGSRLRNLPAAVAADGSAAVAVRGEAALPVDASRELARELARLSGDDARADGAFHALAGCGQYEGTLACASNIAGNLTLSDCPTSEGYIFEFYRITVPANQKFSVLGTSSSPYEILLTVQDIQTGTILSSNHARGSVTATYQSGAATTTFAIGIGYVAKYGTGAYTIAVTCASQNATCPYSGTLACGSSFLGSLVNGDCGRDYFYDVYRINLTAGQTIEVAYTGELPGYIEVSYNDATEGAFVQGTTPLTMRYTASRTGVHDIMISTASAYDGRATAYTVNVTCPSVPPCKQRAIRK